MLNWRKNCGRIISCPRRKWQIWSQVRVSPLNISLDEAILLHQDVYASNKADYFQFQRFKSGQWQKVWLGCPYVACWVLALIFDLLPIQPSASAIWSLTTSVRTSLTSDVAMLSTKKFKMASAPLLRLLLSLLEPTSCLDTWVVLRRLFSKLTSRVRRPRDNEEGIDKHCPNFSFVWTYLSKIKKASVRMYSPTNC